MATAWWPLLAFIDIADTLYPYTTCYLNCLVYFSVVLYCSRIMQRRLICRWSWNFKQSVCHILSLISVDRNVICSLILGWANCGSTCAASTLYAASGQLSPGITVPARNGLDEAHIDFVDYSSALSVVVSLSPPLSNAVFSPHVLWYSCTSFGHHKASNAQPELVSLHGLTNIEPVYPHPHKPPLSHPLFFPTPISPRRQSPWQGNNNYKICRSKTYRQTCSRCPTNS